MKRKGLLIVMLFICVMSLMLGGCLWPSKTDKLKIDSALISIAEANSACISGDCAACRKGVSEANSLFTYTATWDARASSSTKETLSQYAKAAKAADKRSQADCNYAAKALPKLYQGVKNLRSLANGGAGSNN